jgi:hypothetical protein
LRRVTGLRHDTAVLPCALLPLPSPSPQPALWMILYVGAFAVPPMYLRCRAAMDSTVEEALRFVVRVLLSGDRTSMLLSGGVMAAALAVLQLHFILRVSIALVGGFAVLLWHSGAAAAVSHEAAAAQQRHSFLE